MKNNYLEINGAQNVKSWLEGKENEALYTSSQLAVDLGK